MTMADTVAVMNAGRIEQLGPPAELYERPRTTFVANFLGTSNLIETVVARAAGEDLELRAAGGTLRLPAGRCALAAPAPGDRVLAGIRPEKITLMPAGPGADVPAGHNQLTGRVTDASYLGVSWQYRVATPAGPELTVYAQNTGRDPRLAPGAEVVAHWDPAHTFGLDAAQDAAAGTREAAA